MTFLSSSQAVTCPLHCEGFKLLLVQQRNREAEKNILKVLGLTRLESLKSVVGLRFACKDNCETRLIHPALMAACFFVGKRC